MGLLERNDYGFKWHRSFMSKKTNDEMMNYTKS